MAFSGWPERALDFYEGLEIDNSRAYWTAHQASYQEDVLAPMRELTEELAAEFGEPRLFRPYRDVRFSADKSPYKTQIGATFGGGGYVQFSADGLAAGVGRYQMSSEQLARYRAAAASDLSGPGLAAIVAGLEADGIEVRGTGTLKTAPRGYPADHPRIALLRHKGLFAWRHWPPGPEVSNGLAKDLVTAFLRRCQDLSGWLTEHTG